jgi:hypothetical protein
VIKASTRPTATDRHGSTLVGVGMYSFRDSSGSRRQGMALTVLSLMQKRTMETHLGPISLWTGATQVGEMRPVLVVVLGIATPLSRFKDWPSAIKDVAQVVLVELPIREADGFGGPSLERLADALGVAIHEAFHRRPVVILGVGDAALVAAMVRAPEIVQCLAVEPLVQSGKSGVAVPSFLSSLRVDEDQSLRAYLSEVYGLAETGPVSRDHRVVFRRTLTPIDVLLYSTEGPSVAPLEGGGSNVDEADRAWLAAEARVSVKFLGSLPDIMLALVDGRVWDAVCANIRDLGKQPRQFSELGRQLAVAAPRDARRVLFLGPPNSGFVEAYQTYNPTANCVTDVQESGAFDLIVMLDPQPAGTNWVALVGRLEPTGRIVAVTPLGLSGDRLAALFAACGMSPVHDDPVICPPASALVRASKAAPGPVSRVDVVPFARVLMDIRTKLPADHLRSDLNLKINYCLLPYREAVEPTEPPRVVVLQRPPKATAANWQDFAARSMLRRQVLVLEFDDHPELVSQMVRGEGLTAEGWERFRVVHAVQTSTDELRSVFSQYNPNVKVFPNAVFDLLRFDPGSRPARVFYGGVMRGDFAVEVARSLGPAVERYPDTEFLVLGDRAFFEALPTEKKSFSSYVPYERYLQIMAMCRISLSPLQYRPMMETKSDAKYLDASRAGLVTIASPTVYERTIRSGENGLIANVIEDWPAMLALVLGDFGLSERLARAAWEDVRANRMFANQIADRSAWYGSLLAQREAIDREILVRVPAIAARLARLKGV